MLTHNQWALKEWAGVSAGLIQGKSCLILRKGGIRENQDQFLPEHQECWLYPTQFHQSKDQFRPENQELAQQTLILPTTPGSINLQYYAEVTDVFTIQEEEKLHRVLPYQLLSLEVIKQRFHYKSPGLCGLILKCFTLDEPIIIPELSRYAGCKSWVELETSYPTKNLKPVLEHKQLSQWHAEIKSLVTG